MGQAERQHPLLEHRAELIGHLRATPLAGAKQLQPVAVGDLSPAVEGRVVDAEHPAGGAHVAELLSQCERT